MFALVQFFLEVDMALCLKEFWLSSTLQLLTHLELRVINNLLKQTPTPDAPISGGRPSLPHLPGGVNHSKSLACSGLGSDSLSHTHISMKIVSVYAALSRWVFGVLKGGGCQNVSHPDQYRMGLLPSCSAPLPTQTLGAWTLLHMHCTCSTIQRRSEFSGGGQAPTQTLVCTHAMMGWLRASSSYDPSGIYLLSQVQFPETERKACCLWALSNSLLRVLFAVACVWGLRHVTQFFYDSADTQSAP